MWDLYIVSESNFIWSIDDYMKLKFFNIEMYDSIDAYFRYLSWIYVRIIIITDVSISKQFLMTLNSTEKQSHFIQSNCESETTFLTADHHTLQKNQYSDCMLKKCYMYRISIANQCIEIFWRQLTEKHLFKWWVDIFKHLFSYELFD